jgi:hypothetical protein
MIPSTLNSIHILIFAFIQACLGLRTTGDIQLPCESGDLLIALMMEAASTSQTSVNFYHTTRRSNPEDSRLHTRRRENLKSHQNLTCVNFRKVFFCGGD